jgi:hypothetical protein
MDVVNKLEQRKFLIASIVLLIAFGTLIIASWRTLYAMDPFWHLQMARDWIENGLSPWVDHYSYTYNGHEITNPPIIFQGLLYFMTSLFGLEDGFRVFRLFSYAMTMGAVLLLLRQIKASALVYALVIPMLVLLLPMRVVVRPELLSYTFSVVALALYFRAGDRINARILVYMILLMWAWSFYHSSVVGYVIFFGYFLDCAVAQWKSGEPMGVWVKWFGWGVLILAVGFLNPSFSHPLIEAMIFPAEWKILIKEYWVLKVNFQAAVGTNVLIVVALLTPVIALKQRRFGYVVVWAVLAYSAIMMRRMVTPAGIVIVLLAAQLLVSGNYLQQIQPAGERKRVKLMWFVLVVAIGVTVYTNIRGAQFFLKENQLQLRRYPAAIADYMQQHELNGRIFNEYAAGGYLIYRLAHNNKVYIDGRTQILYPLSHMEKYESLLKSRDPKPLREELDKYAVDYILVLHRQSRHDLVDGVGDFGLEFMDATYVLYKREPSNFSLHGKLLTRPECWHPGMSQDLVIERKKMNETLPEYSGLFPFSDLVVGYTEAEDGKAYIHAAFDGQTWFDEMRRFAGYRFLELGEYDLVVSLLGGVQIRKPRDYLAPALAMLKAGEYGTADQIITEFSITKWPKLDPDDMFIYFKLYQTLGQYRGLTAIEREHLSIVKAQLVENGYSGFEPEHELDERSFCPISGDDSGHQELSSESADTRDTLITTYRPRVSGLRPTAGISRAEQLPVR